MELTLDQEHGDDVDIHLSKIAEAMAEDITELASVLGLNAASSEVNNIVETNRDKPGAGKSV